MSTSLARQTLPIAVLSFLITPFLRGRIYLHSFIRITVFFLILFLRAVRLLFFLIALLLKDGFPPLARGLGNVLGATVRAVPISIGNLLLEKRQFVSQYRYEIIIAFNLFIFFIYLLSVKCCYYSLFLPVTNHMHPTSICFTIHRKGTI